MECERDPDPEFRIPAVDPRSSHYTCFANIRWWMALNKLQLKDEKNDFLTIYAPQYRKYILTDSVTVDAIKVAAVPEARNPGVIGQELSMNHPIQRLCHTALAQLRNIADVCHYPTREAAEILVHAFVTTRPDYYNVLFSAYQQRQCGDSSVCKYCNTCTDRHRQTTAHHTSASRPSLAARQVNGSVQTCAAHLQGTQQNSARIPQRTTSMQSVPPVAVCAPPSRTFYLSPHQPDETRRSELSPERRRSSGTPCPTISGLQTNSLTEFKRDVKTDLFTLALTWYYWRYYGETLVSQAETVCYTNFITGVPTSVGHHV